jgi:hypothetical protein
MGQSNTLARHGDLPRPLSNNFHQTSTVGSITRIGTQMAIINPILTLMITRGIAFQVQVTYTESPELLVRDHCFRDNLIVE